MATIKKAQNGVKTSSEKYKKILKKTGEIKTSRGAMQPTAASMGLLHKDKSKKKPDPVLKAMIKKNGGKVKKK